MKTTISKFHWLTKDMSGVDVLKWIFLGGMMSTGTINTITKKIQNDAESAGINGIVHSFEHPWFQTFVMFCGEFMCLLAYFVLRCWRSHQNSKKNSNGQTTFKEFKARIENGSGSSQQTTQDSENSIPKLRWTHIFLFIAPTCLDIGGTSLTGVGLLFVSASVFQILRGFVIISSGILARIFLKRILKSYNWFGMCIVTCGLGVVGVYSFLESQTSSNPNLLLGLALVLCGVFLNSVQFVVEAALLKNRGFEPLYIVGMEGAWGIILMCGVLTICYFVPGSNYGSYENSWDALLQLKNNHMLLGMTILYFISIAFYNFCGLAVTARASIVARTLTDSLRTILVWVVDLIIYYVGNPDYGESWTRYSYIEVIGFCLLVLGTLIYNAVLPIPFFFDYSTSNDPKSFPVATTSSNNAKRLTLAINSTEEESDRAKQIRLISSEDGARRALAAQEEKRRLLGKEQDYDD